MVQDTYKRVILNGVTSYVSVAHHASLNFDKVNPFSLSIRVQNATAFKNTSSPFYSLIAKQTAAPNYTGYHLYIYTDRKIYFAMGDNPNFAIVSGSTIIDVNDIRDITVTYDGSANAAGMKIYLNGVAEALTVVSNAWPAAITNVVALLVGNRTQNDTLLLGFVFSAYVHNRALSEAEVNYNYLHPNNPIRRGLVCSLCQHTIDKPAAGTWLDVSPQTGNNGTITNATTSKYPEIKARCNALFFPTAALTDRVDCGNGASLALGTVISTEFWIKMAKSYTATNPVMGEKLAAGNGWSCYFHQSTRTLQFYSDVGVAIQSVAMQDFLDGAWKHVVFTHTDGAATGEVYVNGVNKTDIRTIRTLTNSANNLFIGNNPGFTNAAVGGYIAVARVYNRILSAAEVLYNMQHPAAPIRRGCVLNLSQESLYGTRWYDLSGNANHGTITGAVARRIGSISGR